MDDPMEIGPQTKPFAVLIQPLIKVLREQLGPGELDAAARVCKAWSTQLAHDVVHVEMCVPGSYEHLLCQLEQLGNRFRNVHSWHLWLPAGSDWAAVDEVRLLWLLSRYKCEKLCLDGRLYWNTANTQLPVLDADVLPWMSSLRSLQTLNLNHCTLANPAGLKYLAFLPDLRTLTCGLNPASTQIWLRSGLDPYITHLIKLQQVLEITIHVENAVQLPFGISDQINRVFAGCVRLQRFKIVLGCGWGVIRDSECALFERVQVREKQADWLSQPVGGSAAAAAAAAGGALDSSGTAAAVADATQQQQQQQPAKNLLFMMDPAAARAAAAAGLDLSLHDLPDPAANRLRNSLGNPPGGLHPPAGNGNNPSGADSDDDSFWPAAGPGEPAGRSSNAGGTGGDRAAAAAAAAAAGLGNAQQQQGPAAAAAGDARLFRRLGLRDRWRDQLTTDRFRDRARELEVLLSYQQVGDRREQRAAAAQQTQQQQQQQGSVGLASLVGPAANGGVVPGSSNAASAAAAAAAPPGAHNYVIVGGPSLMSSNASVLLGSSFPAAAAAAQADLAAVSDLAAAAAAGSAGSHSVGSAQQLAVTKRRRLPMLHVTNAAASAPVHDPAAAAAAGSTINTGKASPSGSLTMRMKRALARNRLFHSGGSSRSPSSSEGEQQQRQQQQRGVSRMVIQRRFGSSPRHERDLRDGGSSKGGGSSSGLLSLAGQQQQQQELQGLDPPAAAAAAEPEPMSESPIAHPLSNISEDDMSASQHEQQQHGLAGTTAAADGPGPEAGSSSSSGEFNVESDKILRALEAHQSSDRHSDHMAVDDGGKATAAAAAVSSPPPQSQADPAAAAAAGSSAPHTAATAAAAAWRWGTERLVRPGTGRRVMASSSSSSSFGMGLPDMGPGTQRQQRGGSSRGQNTANLPMPLNLLDRELGHAGVAPAAAAAAATAATSLSPLEIFDRELGHTPAAAAAAHPWPGNQQPAAAAAAPVADTSGDRPGYVPAAAAAAAAETASQQRQRRARAAAREGLWRSSADRAAAAAAISIPAAPAGIHPAAAAGRGALLLPSPNCQNLSLSAFLRADRAHRSQQLAAAAAPGLTRHDHTPEHVNLADHPRDHTLDFADRNRDLSSLDFGPESREFDWLFDFDGADGPDDLSNDNQHGLDLGVHQWGDPDLNSPAPPAAAAAAAGSGNGLGRGTGMLGSPWPPLPAAAAAAATAPALLHPAPAGEMISEDDGDDDEGLPGLLAAIPAAAAIAPPPAPAAAAAATFTPSLRMPQFNRCTVKHDSVLVTHVRLLALPGPAGLLWRLQQLLHSSPAIAVQNLELGFANSGGHATAGAGANGLNPNPNPNGLNPNPNGANPNSQAVGLAVVGGGRLWQLLLRQMQLVRSLSVAGVRWCEAADDAPHFWRAFGELRGLTQLSFDSSVSSSTLPLPPVPDDADVDEPAAEPAAAPMIHRLQLDHLLMQVLVHRLQKLQTLDYTGDIPPHYNTDYYPPAAAAVYGSSSSSRSRMELTLKPALWSLRLLGNLTALKLEHVGSNSNLLQNNIRYDAQLDLAWLPEGLTQLKLKNLSLSCHGLRSVSDSAATSYAVLLLQQRRANTPSAFVAAAAAADPKGKAAMKLLPAETSGYGSSSSGTRLHSISDHIMPPARLHNLADLAICDCSGVLAAVIGCLAHSTGLRKLDLECRFEPPPLWLSSVAWMWPRLREVSLHDHSTGGKRYRAAAAAAGVDLQGNSGGSSSSSMLAAAMGGDVTVMPDLLDATVTPQLAAAWLWDCGGIIASSSSSLGNSSSSSAACSVHNRLISDIYSRCGSSSSSVTPTWADPSSLIVFASGLANLCKLKLLLPNTAASSSSSRFGPRDLLGLIKAQRLRELVVDLPPQLGYQAAAAAIRSLTQLSRLRLLEIKCPIEKSSLENGVGLGASNPLGLPTGLGPLGALRANAQAVPRLRRAEAAAVAARAAAAPPAPAAAAQPLAAPAAAAAREEAAPNLPDILRLLHHSSSSGAAGRARRATAASAAVAIQPLGVGAAQRPAAAAAPAAVVPSAAAAAAATGRGRNMGIGDLLAQPNAVLGGLGTLLGMQPSATAAAARRAPAAAAAAAPANGAGPAPAVAPAPPAAAAVQPAAAAAAAVNANAAPQAVLAGVWHYSDAANDDDELYVSSESEDEAAAALRRDVAAAVHAEHAATAAAAQDQQQPPPVGDANVPAAAAAAGAAAGNGPAAAAIGGGGSRKKRRSRHLPTELLTEMQRDMPATSVFLHVTMGC